MMGQHGLRHRNGNHCGIWVKKLQLANFRAQTMGLGVLKIEL